jgi:hypothetical protein
MTVQQSLTLLEYGPCLTLHDKDGMCRRRIFAHVRADVAENDAIIPAAWREMQETPDYCASPEIVVGWVHSLVSSIGRHEEEEPHDLELVAQRLPKYAIQSLFESSVVIWALQEMMEQAKHRTVGNGRMALEELRTC